MPVHFTLPDSLGHLGGKPRIDFFWKEVAGKLRLVGNPNGAMRTLHQLFGAYLRECIFGTDDAGYRVRKLPSATGCVRGSNPLLNAQKHAQGKFFYITDLKDAYPSVSLEKLALFITYLVHNAEYRDDVSLKFFETDERRESLRDDLSFLEVLDMLRRNFAGPDGTGLAVGGPLSPYLMNLYCEVYLDAQIRKICEARRLTYTRYVDDLVFSGGTPISSLTRREIRRVIADAGFSVNHRKSKVLAISMGTVHVTKVGLSYEPSRDGARLVFPQKRRRKLHGMIQSYLVRQSDWPEKVSGYVAEFLHYYKKVLVKTRTDVKTFGLCKQFEKEWAKYRHHSHPKCHRRS